MNVVQLLGLRAFRFYMRTATHRTYEGVAEGPCPWGCLMARGPEETAKGPPDCRREAAEGQPRLVDTSPDV